MHFIIGFSTLVIVLATSTLVHASLNLSDIQALVGFPEACTEAYNTPIDGCHDDHFNSGPLCSCSTACSSALDSFTTTIINACQGTAASPNTLIGLFFNHDATNFLCTPPANGGGGGCSTKAAGSSSQQSVSSPASSTTTTASTSQITSNTTTTQHPSSTSAAPSSTSVTMSTSSTTSSTTSVSSLLTTSSTRSSTASTASTRSTTTRLSSSQAKPTTGGGSPFDITSNARIRAESPMRTLSVLLMFAAAIGCAWL